jgi:hypothetical protein
MNSHIEQSAKIRFHQRYVGWHIGPATLLDTRPLISDDVVRLVSKETELQDRIQQLEIDLDVYKRIFTQTNAEKKLLEDENEQLKQISEKQQWQRESLDKQTQAE